MKHVVSGVTIDNGGSEVRMLPYGGIVESDLIKLSNEFVTIEERNFRVKEVDDPKALCRIISAPNEQYLGIVATGLTGRAYNNSSLVISSQESKTDSINYYRQFVFNVARTILEEYLSSQKNKVKSNVNVSHHPKPVQYDCLPANTVYPTENIVYHSVIVTCIPIKEHSGVKDCAQLMKNNLAGEYEAEFPLLPGVPKFKFIIDPKYFGVAPEGGLAITRVRKKLQEDDITLIVDMGHITTDIVLFFGTSLLGKVKSSSYAGSILVGDIRAALEEEGYRITDEQAIRVLETNTVKRGSNVVDVSNIVNSCRISFVNNYLKKEIFECLNMNALNVKQIQNVVFVGAAMNDKGKGSIRQAIIDSCSLHEATILELGIDSRYVNVQTASLFTTKLVKSAEAYVEATYKNK